MNIIKTLLVSYLLIFSSIFASDSGYVFINYLGGSSSFDSYLFLNVTGAENIKDFKAEWDGRSLSDSLYYAMKFEKWKERKRFRN